MINKTNNILVTGAAGYIGSHIVEDLIKRKKNVFIFDNLSTGFEKLINGEANFINGDVKNFNFLKKIIIQKKIDSIIHLAAHLNVSESQIRKKKYYSNNISGTLNVVRACKKSNVRNIIFSSSCSIYGNVKGAVNEKNKPNPQNYYALTKYKGEQIVKAYSKKLKYNYAILRYFNVAGASSSNKIGEIQEQYGHLIKNISIESLKKKPHIYIFGNDYKTKDGTCIRDYIHVSDLSEIHLKALNYINMKSKSLILNCGYGKGYSVLDIVKIFKKIKKKLIVSFKKRRLGDIDQVYANNQKIKKILKWKPKHNNIYKIIQSSIKWEKKLFKEKRKKLSYKQITSE
jgi:UDP-glucose 4-epimerase